MAARRCTGAVDRRPEAAAAAGAGVAAPDESRWDAGAADPWTNMAAMVGGSPGSAAKQKQGSGAVTTRVGFAGERTVCSEEAAGWRGMLTAAAVLHQELFLS